MLGLRYTKSNGYFFTLLSKGFLFSLFLNLFVALLLARQAPAPDDLGVPGGTRATDTQEALEHLEQDSPASVEILLSHATSDQPQSLKHILKNESNPFGHIAIRIKERVFTVNQHAVIGQDSTYLLEQSLEDYLYSTQSPTVNAQSGSNYGVAYARDTIGFRVDGLDEGKIQAMLTEVNKINEEWRSGTLCYNRKKQNCTDATLRILKAGGFEISDQAIQSWGISFPLELFDQTIALGRKDPRLTTELVSYLRLASSNHPLKFQSFPLSPLRPLQMAKQIIFGSVPALNPPEKIITGLTESPSVRYQNLNSRSVAEIEQELAVKNQTSLKKYQELEELEKRLEEKYLQLERDGFNAKQVEARIQESTSPEKSEPLQKYIQEANEARKNLQNTYDEFNTKKLDYLIDRNRFIAEAALERLRMRLPQNQLTSLEAEYEKLIQNYEIYQASRHLYGQPKDQMRLVAYRKCFTNFNTMVDLSGKLFNQSQPRSLQISLRMIWTNLKNEAAKLTQVAPEFVAALGTLFTKGITGPGDTPLNKHFEKGFNAMGKALGVSVNVIGRENIPPLPDLKGNVVNIFAIQHSNAYLDPFAVAAIGLEEFATFGAAYAFTPKIIADKLTRSDHFIVVGNGSDKPIKRTLEILSRNKVRNLVIFPEGSISAGVFETRPLRSKFSWGLLKRLRQAGYQLNIIPISLPDNFRLNNQLEQTAQSPIRAIIEKPIDSHAIEFFEETGDSEAINRQLRQTWLDRMRTDSETLMGMVRLKALKKAEAAQVFGKFCDGQTCSPTTHTTSCTHQILMNIFGSHSSF